MAEGRSAILLESAYFLAFHLHDAAEARVALDLAKGGIVAEQARLRAEAAVQLAEGRYEEAAAKAQAGVESGTHSIDAGGAIAEAEWLAAIREASHERLSREQALRQVSSS